MRNEENKPKLLDNGVEALLRAAKKNHPKTCMDVSSAALRDLGCDNYNEGCVRSPRPALVDPSTAGPSTSGVLAASMPLEQRRCDNTVDTCSNPQYHCDFCTHAPPGSPTAPRSVCLPEGTEFGAPGRVTMTPRPRACRWNPTTVIMGADGVMRTPEELDDEVPGEM